MEKVVFQDLSNRYREVVVPLGWIRVLSGWVITRDRFLNMATILRGEVIWEDVGDMDIGQRVASFDVLIRENK